MSEFKAGMSFKSILQTPLDFYDVIYANGQTIRYSKEPKQGEWIDDDINSNEKYHFFKCSVCGGDGVPRCNFCPNCGADMRVKDELNRVSKELNSEIEKSKGKILPDYCDGLLYSITKEADNDGT